MKKKLSYLKNLASLTLAISIWTSCQHVENNEVLPVVKDQEALRETEGTLEFASATDYYNFFENRENFEVPNFNSMAKTMKTSIDGASNYRVAFDGTALFDDLQDAMIMDLLDSDGMIIIEGYLIFLDFDNLVAAATKDHTLRNEILERNYENEKISVFPFEEDIFDLLVGDSQEEMIVKSTETKENLRVLSNCPGSYPPGSTFPPMLNNDCEWNNCSWTTQYNEAGWSYKAEAKHVYQSAAIYFRLKSEIAHFKRGPGGSWNSEGNANLRITYWGEFTPKNRSTVYLSSCWDSCQGCSPAPANKDKVQKVHHEAGRKLTSYNLFGIYDVHLGGTHAFSGYSDVFQLKNIRKS